MGEISAAIRLFSGRSTAFDAARWAWRPEGERRVAEVGVLERMRGGDIDPGLR